MGAQEFAFCTSLANIYIPNSVLGSDEFQGCTGLTNVTVGPTVTLVADGAFLDCSNLTAVYFQGNAPALGGSPFNNNLSIVYYIPGTVGWGPTFAGRPALAIQMQIQVMDASFGIKTNQFGFNITGSYGLTLVIEATTNLVNPIWYRLQTNTLSTGSSYFRDPTWTNYPRRFYRLSWP
jgi:hypothetical protein